MEASMSNDQTRRNFVGTAGITAATVATAALLRPASAQTAAAALKVEYAIKKLPFDPAKIKGISEKLLVSHYENNYTGAVKRLNAIAAQLAQTDPAAAEKLLEVQANVTVQLQQIVAQQANFREKGFQRIGIVGVCLREYCR